MAVTRTCCAGWTARGLWIAVILIAGGLIAWNSLRFHQAKAEIRMKDLTFLPSPEVAKVLALGQRSTAAKLRWIDSFQYQQLMFDRKDDSLPGSSQGVFQRLYDTLIDLDPGFPPYYDHATLNLAGIMDKPHLAMGYLLRGTIELPHCTQIWRQYAAMLTVNYKMEERNPELLDSVLNQWHEQELDEIQARQVREWKASLAKRVFRGAEQLDWWLGRLDPKITPSGTPNYEFVLQTVREQLVKSAVDQMTAVAKERPDLVLGLHPASDASWDELANQLAARFARLAGNGKRVPPLALAPIQRVLPAGWQLRPDPWGLPWRYADGKFSSSGLERRRYEQKLAMANFAIADKARSAGRWPTTVAEVRALGVTIPEPPADGAIAVKGQGVAVDWSVTGEPWPLGVK